jgi:hypothetical protein
MKRCATLVTATALVIALSGAAAGCASSRSILYSGISSPLRGSKKIIVTDAAALRDAREVRAEWLAMIARVKRQGTTGRFSNLSAQQFRLRLRAAATRYGFSVKKVAFLQETPLVIVQTRNYLDFSRAVPAIEKSLDPHKGRNDSAGWAFRAFFLEAVDEREVPFLVVTNVAGGGGGQWARSDPLFPFIRL